MILILYSILIDDIFDFLTYKYIIYFHSTFSNHKIVNQNLIEIFQLIQRN